MKTSKVLSVTRKADRDKMAAILTERLQNAGAVVTRDSDLESMDKRSIYLKVETERSLSVTVELAGNSPHPDPNTFVLSWHFTNLKSKERISDLFSSSVNEIYRHKATHVCYGFDDLLDTLLRSVKLAQDGSAFENQPIGKIAQDTVILPHVVAEAVVTEVERWLGTELEARSVLIHTLTDKAETVYQNNDRFRKTLRSTGNQGRDTLYAFMRHWLAGQTHCFINGHRLPDSFANGIELQGRAQ